MWVTTIEWLQCFALRKFHLTDGRNMRDQITSDRRSKCAWSHCILCIPFILCGIRNKCWLHTCNACVKTTWRLWLRAPLVARKKFMCQRGWPKHKHKLIFMCLCLCLYVKAILTNAEASFAYAHACMASEDHAMLMLTLVSLLLCLYAYTCLPRWWPGFKITVK